MIFSICSCLYGCAKMKAQLQKLPITLSQFLKWCGAAENGAMAKEMARQGVAKVNGTPCQMPGKQLFSGDKIEIMGEVWIITES